MAAGMTESRECIVFGEYGDLMRMIVFAVDCAEGIFVFVIGIFAFESVRRQQVYKSL